MQYLFCVTEQLLHLFLYRIFCVTEQLLHLFLYRIFCVTEQLLHLFLYRILRIKGRYINIKLESSLSEVFYEKITKQVMWQIYRNIHGKSWQLAFTFIETTLCYGCSSVDLRNKSLWRIPWGGCFHLKYQK